jgi:hypothetical protein
MTEFANGWDPELAMELGMQWVERKLIAGTLIDVEHLVDVVAAILRGGASLSMPSVTVTPRPTA